MNRFLAVASLFTVGLILAPTLVAQSAVANHLTMNQWVQVTDDGALTGRITHTQVDGELDEVHVAILARDGEVLRATSNAKGEFTIPGVQRGVYALTARGKNIFACSAMHVISAEDNTTGRFPKVAEVSVADVDFTTVNTAVIRYMPPKAVTGNLSMQSADFVQLADRVCGNGLFRVARSGGGMKGRIHLAGPDLHGAEATNVFVLRDGIEIDRAITDQTGRFVIDQIDAGHYSLLAVGAGGIGLVGFELVDTAVESTAVAGVLGSASQRLVANQNPIEFSDEFSMQVAPAPEVVGAVEEILVQQQDGEPEVGDAPDAIAEDDIPMDGFGSPLPGGGFAPGGGSFGGGGGGGGGGFGGVAALAGLAGVAAAVSNSNSSGVIVASPSIPN